MSQRKTRGGYVLYTTRNGQAWMISPYSVTGMGESLDPVTRSWELSCCGHTAGSVAATLQVVVVLMSTALS